MTKNPSRKELRKEKRLQKKQRKVDYFINKKAFKDKKKEDREPGRFVRIRKEETDEDVANRKNPVISKDHERQSQDLFKENEKEKQKLKTLQKEMRKQRIKALNHENKMEDKTIKQLEKKLKLNKRKSKTIPRSFIDCGLDYILDVCDSENIQAAVNAEKNLQDSDSEYEEDLAYITGKKNEKTKSKTFNIQGKNLQQSQLPNNFLDNSEESEEEGKEQLLSDYSDEENISAEEMSESDFQENSVVYQEGTDEDNENTKNVDANFVKTSNKVLKNNKKKSFLMESSKNASSISKLISNKSENEKNVPLALEESNEIPMNKESKKPKRKRKASICENMIEEKTIRNESDSEYVSNASEVEEENEREEEEEKGEFWEDIYGRTRDKLGNIIEESKGKYIPPHLRAKSDTEDAKKREQLEKIKKQLKGLLNRLAENNMHSISNQIDEMYMRQSRYDMNETMLNLYLESLISFAQTPERLIMEHAMLIAILQANVGTEIGAFFLQNLGKRFDELHSQQQEIENKELDNLLLLLCHLYTFKVYHCELLYDILYRLCDSFTPKDIDLILVIFRSVGFTLRKDDPLALKQLIIRVQKLANAASDMKDDARVRFMLDVLLGIKNNNMSKLPGYDPTHAEHLKKIIKAMFRKGNYVTELKISLEDLLKADERGRWWIVGSAWTGPAPHSSEKDETMTESLPAFSQEVLNLAKKQRMNTLNRKTIFCILMTAEDYLDSFEKLLKLGLKGQPEQEIVHVLFHCLLSENTYNPYYALIAEQLCMSDRRHQMTIQFSVWDRFKELTSLKKYQITNLAKFLAHLFLQKSLPISVLKVVEFVELDKSGVRLIRQVLLSILLHKDKDNMIEVFNRIAKPTKLAPLRQSLALFLHHFILRNKSINENATPEEKLLQDNVGQPDCTSLRMDVDLLRPGTVPISPDTSLWFEFLLDPNHLEKHLNNPNADPTPTELILKFLTTSQAEKPAETGSENKLNSINQYCSKRCLLLKILALKVAAFLRWDFEIFENKVSLSMQAALLKDLLKLVIPEYADVSNHYNIEFSSLKPEALFAVFLYHRWVINTFVNSMLACKTKPNNVIPAEAGCEEVTEALSERSLEVLRKMSNSDLSSGPLMPSPACFTSLSEHSSEIVKNKWDLGILLSVNQFQCQILMDISSYLLFRESYKEARAALRKCQECFHSWKAEPNCDISFCKVTREVLTGACRAVGILPPHYSPSLVQQFHDSITGMYINVDKILERDNLTKEIPLLYRESLELDIASEVASGKITAHRDVVTQIQASNMVRRALDGGSWHSTNVTPAALNKALTPLVNHATDLEKNRLKYIVGWSLVNGDVKTNREVSELPITKELLKEADILSATETDYNDPMPNVHEYHQIPMSIIGSPNLELAAIERTILTSYNPHEIKSAILKLVRQNPAINLAKLNKNWEIPIPIHNMIMNLPGGMLHNQAFALLTKFYELDEMKNFAQARIMLRTVMEDVTEECGNSQQASKLNQLLMWELLLLDIHQFHAAWPDKHIDWSGLTQRCLQVLHKVEGCLPRVVLREECSLALLNMGQWQALIAAPQVKHSVPLADLYVSIAAACEDINKYNKKINTDAWDKLLPLFISNQKRRDGIVTITNALTSIVEPNALAIVVSLLAKVHNVLKEQPQFDLCIQLLHLWPSAIKNSNQYSIKYVTELLYDVLVHALKHYPNNVPWLKLMGDLHFVNGHHTSALCSYLEAAIAGTDYFSRPLHKNIVEDHIYKRMIKSCTALQCHTQAGVLCQFLDDIDYATAFKSLAEGGCSDAMDAYYDCIWDVNILEYLINLHTKKGEHHRRQQVVTIIGLLELNSNNNDEIKREAENIRKGRFMRAMAAQYLS